MRFRHLIWMAILTMSGFADSFTCPDDEALSSFDGKCTPRKSGAGGGSTSGGSNTSSGAARTDGGSDANESASGVDAWTAAHGTPCMSDADCSPLASFCSTQLHEKCPTAGCCVSKDCAEDDPSTCPAKWHCLYVGYGIDETFCVPD